MANLARLRSLLADRRGNVAIIFGLLSMPILGLAGAAIDYSLAARARGSLQEAIDAGALAGSRLLGTQPEATARAQAEAFVRANLPPRLQGVPLNIEVLNNGQTMRITASTTVETSMLQILGRSALEVSATTTAMAPAYRELEVVLALDNTGSMATAGKMTALREASLELLNLLETSGRRPGDVRVGIVPFSTVVRVDAPRYYQEAWLRGVPHGGNGPGNGWNNGDGAIVWGYGGGNGASHSWYGCIEDRNEPYNTDDTAATNNNTRFPATDCTNTTRYQARVQPLTSDFTTSRNTINAMRPGGNTNVTIGFAWGWHLLSGNYPWTETQTTRESHIDQWLVVLTDGDNTQDRWSTSQSTIDARTRTVCNNLRAQANTIRVVTVRVIEGNRSLLRSCASNENYYYEVSNASQLVEVFRRIAWEITSLRLTN